MIRTLLYLAIISTLLTQTKGWHNYDYVDKKGNLLISINTWNIPDWVNDKVILDSINLLYEISYNFNPFILYGDYNSDGALDCAVLVRNIKTNEIGVIIFHKKSNKYFVIGAGKEFTPNWTNFNLMSNWYTNIDKNNKHQIYVIKMESSSGLIFWDGKKYKWKQLGD